jgi:hypothetical protein
MSFRIAGLAPAPFQALYGLSDDALRTRGVRRLRVDANPGFPDRIELRDADIGEHVLLLNHVHQPADNPYRASHAIFVREGAHAPYDRKDEIPPALATRMLSLRAFDAEDLMIDADVVDGSALAGRIAAFFADDRVAYLHAHHARRGCYAARIDRS